MKKLIFLFIALIVAIGVNAQDYETSIQNGVTFKNILLSTSMTLTNTDTVDIVVGTQVHNPFTIDVALNLDSISGNPGGTLYLLGRKADTEGWSAIANTAWSSADGAVIVSHATAVRYRQLMLRFITSGTGVTGLDSYWAKLWLE